MSVVGFARFDLDVARRGDSDALARMIARSRRGLVRGIQRMSWQTGQGDCDPEDIFQDTIVRCFATVHAMRAETERGFRAVAELSDYFREALEELEADQRESGE